MNGKKAKLFSTDPPYLVDYTGANRPGCFETRDWSDLYREIDIKDAEGFLRGLFSVGLQVCEDNAALYCWHAHKRASLIEKIWHELGILNHQQIIWVKPVLVQSFSFYPWQHEPCLMGWKQGFKPEHDGDNSSFTSVWQLDWEGRARPVGAEHPTMKPIEIFAIPMRKHTKPGDICYEPFSGSGSQIMAGEKTGRCVYANEIQPAFVDVAIRRWQEAAGEDAVLEATGESYTKTAAARGVNPQAAA
jgi:DNA modification methylase